MSTVGASRLLRRRTSAFVLRRSQMTSLMTSVVSWNLSLRRRRVPASYKCRLQIQSVSLCYNRRLPPRRCRRSYVCLKILVLCRPNVTTYKRKIQKLLVLLFAFFTKKIKSAMQMSHWGWNGQLQATVKEQASKQATLFAKIMKKNTNILLNHEYYTFGRLPVKLSLILAGHPFY